MRGCSNIREASFLFIYLFVYSFIFIFINKMGTGPSIGLIMLMKGRGGPKFWETW